MHKVLRNCVKLAGNTWNFVQISKILKGLTGVQEGDIFEFARVRDTGKHRLGPQKTQCGLELKARVLRNPFCRPKRDNSYAVCRRSAEIFGQVLDQKRSTAFLDLGS